MPNQELEKYITQARASGMSDAQIRQNLAAQGWQYGDLEKTFSTSSTSYDSGSIRSRKLLTRLIAVLYMVAGITLVIWAIYNINQKHYCPNGIDIHHLCSIDLTGLFLFPVILFGILLIILGYFLFRFKNWARIIITIIHFFAILSGLSTITSPKLDIKQPYALLLIAVGIIFSYLIWNKKAQAVFNK